MGGRLGIFLLCVMGMLGLHVLRAQEPSANDAGEYALVKLSASDALRMSPLGGGDSSQAVLPEPEVLSDTFARPREYSFTETLLNNDADPLTKDCPPPIALAVALAVRDNKLLERLLDKGIDPNAALVQPVPAWLPGLFENAFAARVLTKDSRVTALMLAVLSEQPDAVRLLLRHGANTEICTKMQHMYPLDFAAELKNLSIMQLLLGHEPTEDYEGRHVLISLYAQKAWLMHGQEVLLETQVSTGRAGFETHTGEFVITQKYTAWKSTLYKAPMPNFMRLNCGPAGMHSGVVPGVPASHGCIRLPPSSAELFYSIVKLGDRVSIVE